jgi:hypothetical protein
MIKRTVLASMLLALAGCAGIQQGETKIKRDEDSAEAIRTLVENNATNGSVIRSNRQRIAGEEIIVRASPLPSIFDEKISYVTRGSQSLVQTLEDISQASGISVRTAEIADLSRGVYGSETLAGNVAIEFSGTRRGLFDEIAGKGNVSWRYNRVAMSVEFFRFETRTLSVNVPAGAQSIAASISLSGVSGGGGSSSGGAAAAGGGGSASSGNVSVSQTLMIDPWTSIIAGVNTILSNGKSTSSAPQLSGAAGAAAAAAAGAAAGGSGSSGGSSSEGSAIPNQDLGLMTVTARPAVLDRVARYLNSINDRFAQNILIDAKVMTVTLNEQTSGGFNLNMLYNPINKLGASIVGPGPLQAGGASPGILTLAPKNPNSRFAGSSLVFDALSQFGKVSLQQQAQTLAVNGQPAPMQVADEINYKNGQSVIPQNGNQGAIVASTQGTKVVGFTANFIPLILGDNRISLAYQLNLSSLTAQTTDPDGTQHPQISSTSLPGHAFMRDGQAIVLFGYGQQRDAVDSALHPAGYSKAATKSRQLTVIVVQVNTGIKNEQN